LGLDFAVEEESEARWKVFISKRRDCGNPTIKFKKTQDMSQGTGGIFNNQPKHTVA
jgi:hypothetical protein